MAVPPPTIIVLPSGVDFVLLASENVSSNLLKGQASNLEQPSLYRLAFQILNETDESAVTRQSGGG